MLIKVKTKQNNNKNKKTMKSLRKAGLAPESQHSWDRKVLEV